MRIHALQTGRVWVHERQRSGKGAGVARFIRTLLDRQWTEPLPIYAWAIEHPEGVIVVDTGETSRTGDPGYFPWWHPYYRLAVRAEVAPEHEVGPQLRRIGIDPGDVGTVVMTHLHTDHAGGLHHFPASEVLVSRTEYEAARGFVGRLRGYLPNRWPRFDPTLVDFEADPVGPFPASIPITRSGDVRLVPTPGHTAGHMSVLVHDAGHDVLLAGDTSYTEANLLSGRVDGVSSMGAGEGSAAQTLERIRAYAAETPLVYLPSHDPDAADRLDRRQTVPAAKLRAA